MPCQFSMIFSGIFENIWHWEHNRGSWHLATRVQGAPLPRGPMVAPLHSFLHPHTPSSSQKNHHPAQARVLAHFAAIFDLLLGTPFSKLFWWFVLRYVTPPMVQLVFVLVLYILQIFAAVVTLFLSLHVKFLWSKVVLFHDIASRHLWE